MSRTTIAPDIMAAFAAIIKPLDTPERRQAYIDGNFPRADKVKDLNVRYRWDLLWQCPQQMRWSYLMQTRTGEEIHDSHIDTMLRRIIEPLADPA